MRRDDIGELIRELPRTEASPDFTDSVLERLGAPPLQPHTRSPLVWAIAVTASVGLAAWGGWKVDATWRAEQERRREAARIERLRNEYRELEAELDELRALTAEAEPVLDLGGTERVEFVLDLRRLAAMPASHGSP